jgi:hypothetical protein
MSLEEGDERFDERNDSDEEEDLRAYVGRLVRPREDEEEETNLLSREQSLRVVAVRLQQPNNVGRDPNHNDKAWAKVDHRASVLPEPAPESEGDEERKRNDESDGSVRERKG